MNTKNTASDQEMKKEGAERMKLLGLPQSFINEFLSDNQVRSFHSPEGTSQPIDEWEDQVLGFYDQHYGGYPWGLIKEIALTEEGHKILSYYILFVSDDPEQWQTERKGLTDMEPTVYMVKYDELTYPDSIVEGFTKKRIVRIGDGFRIFQ